MTGGILPENNALRRAPPREALQAMLDEIAPGSRPGRVRRLPDPAIWLPGYGEVGRGRLGVTPRVIRSRLHRWIRGVIASSGPASARALAP